jgi:hypothetical protein
MKIPPSNNITKNLICINDPFLTVFEFYIFRGEYVELNILAWDPLLGEIDGN